MKKNHLLFIIAVFAMQTARLSALPFDNPFSVSAVINQSGTNPPYLRLTWKIPPGNHIYADSIKIKPNDKIKLVPLNVPAPLTPRDNQNARAFYDHDFTSIYSVLPAGIKELSLAITYQGCNAETCFFPTRINLTVSLNGGNPSASAPIPAAEPEKDIPVNSFKIIQSRAGYMSAPAFIDFMNRALTGEHDEDRLLRAFRRGGIWIVGALILIVIFGAGLNLTPCVLPMIPVNIAIIGAGAASKSRRRGAALGLAYGVAMAIVYGLLGILVVLTGAKFGALNASWIFNLAIAVIFVMLAMAMFDLFVIDFSRFQSGIKMGSDKPRGSLTLAFFMGGIAALLAGACVAPVLISVLLLTTRLYASGLHIALLLPFLLGAGMGLPWPFLGAGMAFLPKPGNWMKKVKAVFGVIILLLAFYYGHLAISLFREAHPAHPATAAPAAAGKSGDTIQWTTSLQDALQRSRAENKPVLMDFWASWCKNCTAMEKNTFKNKNVIRQMSHFIPLKIQAENPNTPAMREMLNHFGVMGLPTYVIIKPIEKE